MAAGNVLTALADLFLPRLCCVCGGELGRSERYVCLNCLADMPLTFNWMVRRNPMAERFNALIEEKAGEESDGCQSGYESLSGEVQSGTCLSDESLSGGCPADGCFTGYVDAVALFNFIRNDSEGDGGAEGRGQGGHSGGYRNITYRLKYSRDIREGSFFAAMLGGRAARAEWLSDVDAVIPVPLHWTRRLRRGYNQAEVIASELAKALGARLHTDILVRKRRTKTQTRLGIEEKAENVRGAFELSGKFRRRCHRSGIPGDAAPSDNPRMERNPMTFRHILLVDDVFTTGSTLYNCWLPLRKFFGPSVRISIATLGVV